MIDYSRGNSTLLEGVFMFTIYCYNEGCDSFALFDAITPNWHYICWDCQPLFCKNESCYALASSEGLCEGCDEIGFVRDGEFVLFDDDADAGYDMSADAEWLASAGWGTDEDYGG